MITYPLLTGTALPSKVGSAHSMKKQNTRTDKQRHHCGKPSICLQTSLSRRTTTNQLKTGKKIKARFLFQVQTFYQWALISQCWTWMTHSDRNAAKGAAMQHHPVQQQTRYFLNERRALFFAQGNVALFDGLLKAYWDIATKQVWRRLVQFLQAVVHFWRTLHLEIWNFKVKGLTVKTLGSPWSDYTGGRSFRP